MRSKTDTSTSHQHFEISLLKGEKRPGSWVAAALVEVLRETSSRTDKTVTLLMETSEGNKDSKVWYEEGMRSLSICSEFKQARMRCSVQQARLFLIRQLHFHPLVCVDHTVYSATLWHEGTTLHTDSSARKWEGLFWCKHGN